MTDPYRGFAEVTHDTNRVAEVITELNQLNSDVVAKDIAQDNAITNVQNNLNSLSSGLPATYAISPNHTMISVDKGDGTTVYQTLNNASVSTIDLINPTVRINNGSGWDSGAGHYFLPATGIYVLNAWLRPVDGFGTSCNLGLGISLSNSTNTHVIQWHKYVTGGGVRATFGYHRMGFFTQNDAMRLFAFQDSGGNMGIVSAGMQIWRTA